MTRSIAELISSLHPDPWRQRAGFSPEVEAANRTLFSAKSDSEAAEVLNAWLKKHQPCVFGKHAAASGLISYCILTESDLRQPDGVIRDKIQAARREWTAEGFDGDKSGFVILAISPAIAYAEPNDAVKALAHRLCSLYLLRDVRFDEVELDEAYLEMRGKPDATFRWDAGVNYFCAQGDGRWWRDHRIPGGMAFSINSVGHMVKSAQYGKGMKQLAKELEVPDGEWNPSNFHSLGEALKIAMLTIKSASDGKSGRATELMARGEETGGTNGSSCPVKLPPDLADKDCHQYRGYYHTDHTLPSVYFCPDVDRPEGLEVFTLDLTYLFDNRPENPDYINMGTGRRIRAEGETAQDGRKAEIERRKRFMVERIEQISDHPRLQSALEARGVARGIQ
jgi:hypothetical protein